MKYLPSKKFIVIAVSLLILLGIAFGIDYFNRKRAKNEALETGKTLEQLVSSDTDGDGVSDWQEALFGTDPQKTDTNEDGTSDYDEIQLKKSELSRPDGTINETEVFSRELFSTLTSLQSTGNLTDNAIENISDSMSTNLTSTEIKDAYTIRQLSVTSTTNASLVKNYYETMKKTYSDFSARGMGDEVELWEKTSDNQTVISNDLYEIADLYISYSQKLLTVKVPPELATLHLATANTHYKIGAAIRDMALYQSNSVKAMGGFAHYRAYIEFLGEINTQFKTYFSKYDIL